MDYNDYFYYDETSPSCLRWKVNRCCGKDGRRVLVSAGELAGTLGSDRRWRVRLDGKLYLVHRIVWVLFNPAIDGNLIIDHKSGDPTDNRLGNLRMTTQAVNTRNAKMSKTNTSGVPGVNRYIKVDSKTGREYHYWRAYWHDGTGRELSRSFSVGKLGEDAAFLAACDLRATMIDSLNATGAGYTERHGKEAT
jgi:hypothetical protein